MITVRSRIAAILKQSEGELLAAWTDELLKGGSESRTSEAELRTQTSEFLSLLQQALQFTEITNMQSAEWQAMRNFLHDLSLARVTQGYSASQTAVFIFSFKKPLFASLRQQLQSDADALAQETWFATELLDKLGLLTFEAYQHTRDDVIRRQQEELLELSTPVVKLWDGILALPVIGTLDRARTQIVMESLLQRIVATNSRYAIIDITGVPTVDTLVAQHLLKTITAARLMGAECIISGVRPQIAQTIVHLGNNLEDVSTKAKLSDAFALALQRSGRAVVKSAAHAAAIPLSGLFGKREE